TDLNEQFHDEAHGLTVLNERFGLFVEYVKRLEEHNATYIAQLTPLRRHWHDISIIENEYNESYLHLNSNLMALNNEKIDEETAHKMFQLQADIYLQLIKLEQYKGRERFLELEQELNKTSTMLSTLRGSYVDR
ncbi:unnamed protein product, partial [Rotaria sp. Silwood2]